MYSADAGTRCRMLRGMPDMARHMPGDIRCGYTSSNTVRHTGDIEPCTALGTRGRILECACRRVCTEHGVQRVDLYLLVCNRRSKRHTSRGTDARRTASRDTVIRIEDDQDDSCRMRLASAMEHCKMGTLESRVGGSC